MNTSGEPADERETVLRAQKGERAAFTQLVDAYDQRLLYFVRRILGEYDGAFDVLQSVWLTVHRNIHRLNSANAFRIWVYRIAHDKAVNAVRKRTRRPLLVDVLDAVCNETDKSDAESSFDNVELIHVALKRLSLDHRRILTLRFLEDMTIKEIAEVLGCKEGTVKSRLHHARRELRLQIEEIQNV